MIKEICSPNSSAHNHGLVWGTWRNHLGWKMYLGKLYGTTSVPPYASPSCATDYAGMPPAYSYVNFGEPFRDEVLTYISKLNEAGVKAQCDVFDGSIHAFDFFPTKNARYAKNRLCQIWERDIMCS